MLPARTSAGSDHHLRGLLGAGELHQCSTNVIAHHFVIRATELHQQCPVGAELIAGPTGETVLRNHMHTYECPSAAASQPGCTPDHHVGTHCPRNGHHHTLPRFPGGLDVVGVKVVVEGVLHLIGQP